jgi:hypothetical protein
MPLPAGGAVSVGKDESVTLDLAKTGRFEGQLSKLAIANGKLTLTMGGAPAPTLPDSRTGGNPNYCEVVADGEVALASALIRNASVLTLDNTPKDPYAFNHWDDEGYARIESGDVILDEARLKARFANAGGGFSLDSAKLVGTDMQVSGSYDFIGIPVPISFKIGFSLKDGKLRLSPHDVSVLGFISYGRDKVLDALAALNGCTRDGDGVLLDLKKSASVELPNVKTMRTEPGRIVLAS